MTIEPFDGDGNPTEGAETAEAEVERLGDTVNVLESGHKHWLERAEAAEAEIERLERELAEARTNLDYFARERSRLAAELGRR